ncbi:extracellular solute-binding protein [Streptomyces sp. NPDC048636]|uniref:ABC transporter substrate-binding protein n=1 Tax=Streptomyces sp. NPDC048636 TaxID=3155762 RepID=UPI0034460789
MSAIPETGLTRRRLVQLLGGASATAALAACAGPGSSGRPTASGGPKPPATGKAEGAVSFTHFRGEDKQAFAELINKFERQHKGVTVNQVISTSQNYLDTAIQKVRDGRSGDTLPAVRGAQFHSFVEAGIFTDLSDTKAARSYVPDRITVGRSKGKQLGFPYQILLLMPVINEDAFDKAGATITPRDWDAFLDVCDKLKSRGYTPIAFPGGDLGNSAQLFNSLVLGDAPVDDMCARINDGRMKVTDDWFLKVLQKYKELGPYFQSNFTGTSYESAQQIFASEKAAMLSTGTYSMATVRSLGAKYPLNMIFPKTGPKVAKKTGVYNATFILGVNAAGRNQPAAYEWLEFLSDPENAQFYANKTAQFSSVAGVSYENADLEKTAGLLEGAVLAPRFQMLNNDIGNAVFELAVKAANGANIEKAAEETQNTIDQKL